MIKGVTLGSSLSRSFTHNDVSPSRDIRQKERLIFSVVADAPEISRERVAAFVVRYHKTWGKPLSIAQNVTVPDRH